MHLHDSRSVHLDRCLFIGRQDISCGSLVAYFGYGIVANPQALNHDFSVLICLKGLVIVHACHTEREALHLTVRGSLYDFKRAFLCCIDKSYTRLIFHGVGLAVLLNGYGIHIFIKHKACRSFGFLYQIFAVAEFTHLVNAAVKFFHFAKQRIVFIQFPIAISIGVNLKYRTRQLVVGIILINLCQSDIALNEVVDKFDFHNFVHLADCHGDFFLGEYISLRAFDFTDYPSSIRHFGKRKTTIIF